MPVDRSRSQEELLFVVDRVGQQVKIVGLCCTTDVELGTVQFDTADSEIEVLPPHVYGLHHADHFTRLNQNRGTATTLTDRSCELKLGTEWIL
jgi:hypothetical protein